MTDETKQRENSAVPANLQPHVFKKGQSGNPNGRPKGSVSLKTYAKAMLEEMDDEQRQEFLQGLPKQFVWEMAEGKAESKTNTDVTSGGEKIVFMPPEVLARLDNDESAPETE